jgi:hypothetical protein
VRDNVHIDVYERGKRKTQRSGHNVWVEYGNQYLSEVIAYALMTPLTSVRDDRIQYMGFGIGGRSQSDPSADAAPFSTVYPAGSDPHASDGHAYRKDYPIYPPITTLERPVRFSGGSGGGYPSSPSEFWLVSDPSFYTTHLSPTSATFHAVLDGSAGDVLNGFFTYMPLSEVGLFTSAADVHQPFNPLVAYFNFDTFQLTADTIVELVWEVRF